MSKDIEDTVELGKLFGKLAQVSPEMKKLVEEATGFDKAAEARDAVNTFIHDLLKGERFSLHHVLFGLVSNAALTAYIQFDGDRANARDRLSASLDGALDVVEGRMRESGGYDKLREARAAAERGDTATLDRLIREAQDAQD